MKIEALAFAIAKTCGAFTPDSEAFRLNNPGLLRAYGAKEAAAGGLRKFNSWQAGFRALCFDLELKCSGQSRAKLDPQDPLTSLFRLWEIKEGRKVISFLRRALDDDTITENTPLGYFV